LPGSQATSNVLTDFDNLIGKDIEVMPFRYIEGTGFLVSRKKYLQRVIPDEVAKLKEYWKQNPDRIYEGTVTGPGRKLVSQPGQPREYGDPFGVFVELSEFYTGLLHHTYMVDDSAEHMLSYKPGDKIKVQIYTITDDNRIVFTNIFDKTERDEIVSKREAEDAVRDEAEKKAAAEVKAKREAARQQKVKNAADKTFNGNAINSFADLKSLIK
jgi:predicted RNA-binding protein with RPS1 domain